MRVHLALTRARTGPDLPESCTTWLSGLGVDLHGLRVYARDSPRAWQVISDVP